MNVVKEFLGDNIFIALVFVLYIIKTRFTQNTCISWFLMLDVDFFQFPQAQGTLEMSIVEVGWEAV